MSLRNEKRLRVVFYEGEGAERQSDEDRFATYCNLLEKGFALSRVSGEGKVAPSDGSSLLVLGQFSRGMPVDGETDLPGAALRFVDIKGLGPHGIVERVESVRHEVQAVQHGQWKPWFPVIDYDRCTNCMQCLSFCLFGVYGVDEQQKIQVQNNDQCKTNCPACSRVCPEAAIMFPKYKAGPINGDVVSQADLSREKMKVDISALLGGDIYAMLRERSERAKSRFSKERDSDKALKERQKCLVKLQQMGDIPAEVLMALPSPEEIQKRAREAMARAQEALGKTIQE